MRTFVSLALFLCIGAGDAAAEDDVLGRLQKRYACPIYTVLETIRAHEMTKHGRFVAVDVDDGDKRYVQCLFHDGDRSLYCEVASGAYDGRPLTAQQIAVLASLGFDVTNSKANYSLDRPIADSNSLMDVANLMVEVLYRAYRVGLHTRLSYQAPFAPGHDLEALPQTACAPAIS